VPDGDVLAAADELLRIVQHTATAPPWLQFVYSFFGPQISRPPEDLASTYFNRAWYTAEFKHEATSRTNFYAAIVLGQTAQGIKDRPQVFHFAFRHPTRFRARWLQYGLVRVDAVSATLHHIDGHIQQLERSSSEEPISVETWFGQGPALFCVASLHPFSHIVDASGDSARNALRFPA
jgi:hypothetical protein